MDPNDPPPRNCLPNDVELTVEEIPVSSPGLRAAAHHLGKFCDEESKEFMLCRQELLDPRLCIKEGRAVTACAMNFFRKLKVACRGEFEAYSKCLEYSSPEMHYRYCRDQQGVYDKCMLENMDMERPETGYFSLPRVHQSKRPEPPLRIPKVYPDPTPGLPDDYPRDPAVYGARLFDL
uniref:NADH dehydrogenase [ubiquinone] 1 alpha subcomplex subunit 8 n=1 Tax=Strigamia maritima TaxID=126957 RepID=T1J0Q6_STRMM